ncbi:MAG: IS200/IS605 family transposase [Candidatus Vecturithrix sp.]|jgi:REP element-mobilizing transposase RayT|nr:IS200/IS605 family transposase [Candidatus Vecturithrix sp.]
MGSSLTNLLYHIVFSTKMRHNLITPDLAQDLYPYIGGIIRDEKGALLKIGGMPNHVHLLTKFHPSISVSTMLQHIKGSSSKWINEGRRIQGHFSWQTGYSAFSVSESAAEAVTRYIETQAEHHQRQTYQEELIALLQKHRIPYDERYIWD